MYHAPDIEVDADRHEAEQKFMTDYEWGRFIERLSASIEANSAAIAALLQNTRRANQNARRREARRLKRLQALPF